MPDQNNPFDNQNPAPDDSGVVSNPPADTPTIPTTAPDKPEGTDNKPLSFPEDTNIPPISPDMVKDSPTFTPSQTISDSTPLPNPDGSAGVPPMVPSLTPKKKFRGKKMIATILGILVLLGSLGAGIFLVKQQQDIRERAVYPTPIPEAKCSKDSVLSCIGKDPGDVCGLNKLCKKKESFGSDGKPICGCISQETPTPTPTSTPLVKCTSGSALCLNKKPGDICSGTTKCTPITTPGPGNTVKCICEEEPPTPTPTPLNKCSSESAPKCVGKKPGDICSGTIRCFPLPGKIGADGLPKCMCEEEPPTPTPTTSYPPGVLGRCVGIKAYDSKWDPLTSKDMATTIKVGDTIFFAIKGEEGPGEYDQAQFMINGKEKPSTDKPKEGIGLYQAYIIQNTDVGKSISVKARIHNTVLGWSEY